MSEKQAALPKRPRVCGLHKRHLTYAEFLAGRCAWCDPAPFRKLGAGMADEIEDEPPRGRNRCMVALCDEWLPGTLAMVGLCEEHLGGEL